MNVMATEGQVRWVPPRTPRGLVQTESILIPEEKQKGSEVGEDRRVNAERRQGEPHKAELISDKRSHERREAERRTMPRASFEARNLSS